MALNGTTKSILRIASAVAGVGVILTAIFTVDGRYVHADDFKKQMFVVKDSIIDLHRARIEDEIFKLELVPPAKRTQQDNALLDRYKNQIKEIDSKREKSQ